MPRFVSYDEGALVHCIHRGVMGTDIFRDDNDKWRFIRLLYLLNDTYIDNHLSRTESTLKLFERPDTWPERDPLVEVLAFVVMPNHFHLLLREKKKGSIGKFMQRLSGSITLGFNKKYNSVGTIFQS